MGRGRSKGIKTEARGNGRGQNPWECGETLGCARHTECNPRPTEWGEEEGGREAFGVEETLRGDATEWTGESSRSRTT